MSAAMFWHSKHSQEAEEETEALENLVGWLVGC